MPLSLDMIEVRARCLTMPDRLLCLHANCQFQYKSTSSSIFVHLWLTTLLQRRLKNHEYATLEVLEGDVKRLIQNARDFNERGSVITDDAERLRKAMANFMPKHNPKYQDPNYKAVPTPIASQLENGSVEKEKETPSDERRQSLKIKLTNKRALEESPTTRTPTPKPASTPKPVLKPTRRATNLPSFEGMDFQKANEQIIQEMIELRDEEYAVCQAVRISKLTFAVVWNSL